MKRRPAIAIILAAGRGSRMFPLASPFSKTLLPVHGSPVVAYAARAAAPFVERMVVVTNPLTSADVSAAVIEGIEHEPKIITTAIQYEPNGVADAISVGIGTLMEDSTIVVLCGDNLLLDKRNVETVLSCVQADEGECASVNFSWTYREFDSPLARQFAVLDPLTFEHGILIEKPDIPPSRICWCGPIAFRSSDEVQRRIARLHRSARGEYEITELINTYLMNGEARRFPLSGIWSDIGHRQALVEANDLMSELTRE